MPKQDRYFIFNHREAFEAGGLYGLVWQDNKLTLEENQSRGVFISPVMDSLEQNNPWQRVTLDALEFTDTRITCAFYSIALPYEAQSLEIMLSDLTIGLDEKLRTLERFKAFSLENSQDFLLRNVKGRYLIAVIELYRQGQVSPSISKLQIYASQESFLSYLPEIFQDEGSFLDRYLRMFSVQYLEMERNISRLPASFDPRSAPENLLPWLAELMGIPNISLWEAAPLRRLLTQRTYARKGTLTGLAEIIKIYTGNAPYIAESFRMVTGIEEMDKLYGGCRMVIMLPWGSVNEAHTKEALHLIIQSYLAEQINYKLIVLENCARISGYSYLDINACLIDYNNAVLDANNTLGYAVLGG